jgi:hypothetical protein
MQSWISDLEERHTMFIQTMVQLEQEAGDRVLLLQEGLHRSSQAALAYRTKLDDYDKDDFLEKVCAAVYGSLFCSQRMGTLRRFGLKCILYLYPSYIEAGIM